MKKLLILLLSILIFSSPSVYADDISDFQIEGISIGDSLLDYMTEDEILEEIELNKNSYSYLKESNKYVQISIKKNLRTYDFLAVFIKNNSTSEYITNKNEKYIIMSVRGMMNFIEDFDSCLKKRDEIVEVVSKMFPNQQKIEDFFVMPSDPSGESIVDGVYFIFNSGAEIEISCDNFEETYRNKNNWSEGLNVSIDTKEILSWGSDW